MSLLDAERPRGHIDVETSVVWLSDEPARHAELAGAKAANLAIALASGHPVLPGFVITPSAAGSIDEPDVRSEIELAWKELSDDGRVSVVVRSSSAAEDTDESSRAGQFTSVIDVEGWSSFVHAVRTVYASRDAVGIEAPMAVLVQPWLDAEIGGVAFGRDPMTGTDDIVVSAVRGGPHTLVNGDQDGTTVRLHRHGRLYRSSAPDDQDVDLSRRMRHRLAALVRRLGREFHGPQDVEWAVDPSHRLWLLQSRPVTTHTAAASGPIFGSGPIAETFPDQLAPLEEDLWLPPLREALAEALVLSGTRRRAQVERSPVLVSVDGRPAVDLDVIGAAPARHRWWRALDPRPGARRLAAAWRVGRLRAALPTLGRDAIGDADEALLDVPALDTLSDTDLLRILENARPILRALHGHEILSGMLSDTASAPSLATVALAKARLGRASGKDDGDIIRDEPVTLWLVPPRIGPVPSLPAVDGTIYAHDDSAADLADADASAKMRDALRLRVRWVHELTARVSWELAERLVLTRRLSRPDGVRHMRFHELRDAVSGGPTAFGLRDRILDPSPPLPNAFRLREDGSILAVGAASVATGAGGGRAAGVVYQGDEPPQGAVLVVDHLRPELAGVLPKLSGLIAETGSPLSHLAILARELGIATVVGYPNARTDFDDGDTVIVDGGTGEVTRQEVRS
jgi:phosphohistidine swiveling domain-containing protein